MTLSLFLKSSGILCDLMNLQKFRLRFVEPKFSVSESYHSFCQVLYSLWCLRALHQFEYFEFSINFYIEILKNIYIKRNMLPYFT